MAAKCQVCYHPEAKAIDEAIVNGVSIREIVERYQVSRGSVYRHKNKHLPKAIVKAKELEEIAKADSLLEQAKDLQVRTLAILERHEGKDDVLALRAIREARNNLDLIGRVLGELDNSPKVAVLVNNPDWAMVRSAIVEALEPYPEARGAVISALQRISE